MKRLWNWSLKFTEEIAILAAIISFLSMGLTLWTLHLRHEREWRNSLIHASEAPPAITNQQTQPRQ